MLSTKNPTMSPTIDKLIRTWARDYDIQKRWGRDDKFHLSFASWRGLPSSYHYAQLDACVFYAGKGQRILHKGLEFGGLLSSGAAGDIALLLKGVNALPDVLSG